jgi:hypothetical protein
MSTEINAPVTKAVVGLGAGAATSGMSMAQKVQSFFPTDATGWAAFAASCFAVGYTATIWGEWWWKKFWKPFLKRRGWVR